MPSRATAVSHRPPTRLSLRSVIKVTGEIFEKFDFQGWGDRKKALQKYVKGKLHDLIDGAIVDRNDTTQAKEQQTLESLTKKINSVAENQSCLAMLLNRRYKARPIPQGAADLVCHYCKDYDELMEQCMRLEFAEGSSRYEFVVYPRKSGPWTEFDDKRVEELWRRSYRLKTKYALEALTNDLANAEAEAEHEPVVNANVGSETAVQEEKQKSDSDGESIESSDEHESSQSEYEDKGSPAESDEDESGHYNDKASRSGSKKRKLTNPSKRQTDEPRAESDKDKSDDYGNKVSHSGNKKRKRTRQQSDDEPSPKRVAAGRKLLNRFARK